MIEITEIRQTSPERFILTMSDGTQIKATLSVITDLYIHSGMELDGEEYERLVNECAYSLCKARALRQIGMRAMSAKEMRDKLVSKGETPENAQRAADWLCEMGLINDEAFAGTVVRHYAAKGYGRSRIRNELYRHGVPRDLWEEALEEMPEQDDKIDKYLRSRLTDPSDRAQVKRVSDGLFRRGYSWGEIKVALERFKAELEETEC